MRFAPRVFLGVLGMVALLLAATSTATLPSNGEASGWPLGHGAVAPAQQADEQRHYIGTIDVTAFDADDFPLTLLDNQVLITLPPAGQPGPISGKLRLYGQIDAVIFYTGIAELAGEVGAGIGESIAGASDSTPEPVEVPPELLDCELNYTIGGTLLGAVPADTPGGTDYSGDGDGALEFDPGTGCEDTDAAGSAFSAPLAISWTATLVGDRLTGTIVSTGDSVTEYEFEATLDDGSTELSGGAAPATTNRGTTPGNDEDGDSDEGSSDGANTADRGVGDQDTNPLTDLLFGDGGIEVSREDAATAAAAGAGVAALTTILITLTNTAKTGGSATDHLLDALESGPTIGDDVIVGVYDTDGFPEELALDQDSDGVVDSIWSGEHGTESREDVTRRTDREERARTAELESRRPADAPTDETSDGGVIDTLLDALEAGPTLGQAGDAASEVPGPAAPSPAPAPAPDTATEPADAPADETSDGGVIDALLDGLAAGPTLGQASDAASEVPVPAEGAGDDLADSIIDLLEDAPPIGADVTGQAGAGEQTATGFDLDGDGSADDIWDSDRGRTSRGDTGQSEAFETAWAREALESQRDLAAHDAAVARTGQADATDVEEPSLSETAESPATGATRPAEQQVADAPTPPADAPSGADLAGRLRTHPRAQFMDAEDLGSLGRLLEDPEVMSAEVAPPLNQSIAPGVTLADVANTETGVSLTLTNRLSISVGVEDGRLAVGVPVIFEMFTGPVNDYLDQINGAFASSGREIASISQNDGGMLEVVMRPKTGE